MPIKSRNSSLKLAALSIIMGFVLLIGAVSCQASQTPELPEVDPHSGSSAVGESPDPTEVVEEVVLVDQPEVVVDECLACHTDQQILTDTADPVVVLESENAGEG